MSNYSKTLRYRETEQGRATVKRHYEKWRKDNDMRYLCDNTKCQLHDIANPQWNGEEITLILDHENGSKFDNSPYNLRLLCPNCNSQLPTAGGRNKGRIMENKKDGYTLNNDNGSKSFAHFPQGGIAMGGHAEVSFISSTTPTLR